jgi:hypothetical protein
MAFSPFNLTGTSFSSDSSKGPLGPLYSNQKSTNLLQYPIDLGTSADKGHYMVLYIKKQTKGDNNKNVPTSTGFGGSTNISTAVKTVASVTGLNISGTNIVSQVWNAFNSLVGGNSNATAGQIFQNNSAATAGIIQNSIKNKQGAAELLSNFRKTEMTSDTIALYMPDTLMYSYNQSYESLSPGKSVAGQIAAQFTGKDNTEQGKNLTNLGAAGAAIAAIVAEKKLSALGGDAARLGIYKALGGIVNPMLEVIYSTPAFRQFRFDFSFFPRSRAEALMVQNIIERLRFHQAPDLVSETGAAILIPPSEFDIKFYYAGSINPNIDSIGNCVLTSIDVNYAPNGFQAYEVPTDPTPSWGGTGMPVEIQLSLNFQETIILTKFDFESGYAGSSTQLEPSQTPNERGVGQGNNPISGQTFATTPGGGASGRAATGHNP